VRVRRALALALQVAACTSSRKVAQLTPVQKGKRLSFCPPELVEERDQCLHRVGGQVGDTGSLIRCAALAIQSASQAWPAAHTFSCSYRKEGDDADEDGADGEAEHPGAAGNGLWQPVALHQGGAGAGGSVHSDGRFAGWPRAVRPAGHGSY